jgi:phosphoribosylamine---glycine ligase
MKVLVVGSGGREHAIVWAIQKTSPVRVQIFCAPGNAGIGQNAQLVPLSALDHAALARFAESERIDLTFIGPETPLAAGIVDRFAALGLPIVGPSGSAAQLEASKVFAKGFMARYGIPTAPYRVGETPQRAIQLIRSGEFGAPASPIVIKADGLAAGKGVVIAKSHAEAEKAIEDLMINQLAGAEAGARVVIEEALEGAEVSLLVFTDGQNYALMPAARDHKRIGENDTGPNTGGMGSITDSSILDNCSLAQVVREIVEPTLAGAEREGFPFKGILFLGLMLTAEGPKLLEYNVRFGDPETQAILVRLKTDLLSIFEGIRQGTLDQIKVEWSPGASACVVLVNQGYPGEYQTGAVIEGLDEIHGDAVQVFHAGTSYSAEGQFTATGGRVLGVTAAADKLSDALRLCYQSLEKIHWPGMRFRRDIGRSTIM